MTQQRSSVLRAYAGLGLTMFFWAGNAIVGRAVRDLIPPFTLAFGRWSLAIALVLPFALKPLRRDWPLIRRQHRAVIFLGLVGVAGFNGFLYSGLHYTTASNGLLLQALIPALVMLVGAVAFGDRPRVGQVAGVLLSTVGVAVIVFRGDPSAILDLGLGYGDILILLGCIAWAVYTACLRLRPAIQPLSFIFLTFCIGAITMAPFAAAEFRSASIVTTPLVVGAFAYVAVFPSLVAYFLYNDAVARVGAASAGQTISLMPVFGALLATQLLGEELHGYHVSGMAMIVAGIVLNWLIRPRAAL